MMNACVVGIGLRGYSLLRDVLLNIKELNIVAVCDVYDEQRLLFMQ